MSDIVDRLERHADLFEGDDGALMRAAAAEIERLRLEIETLDEIVADLDAEIERLRSGGCARNQRLTQYCAEVPAAVLAERDACHAAVMATVSDHDEDTPGGWCAANAARHAAAAIRARTADAT